MLSLVDLRKTYVSDGESVPALKGVSFDVAQGQFFTLLGPSGSGKSTAMRCVAGLEHPDSGEIYIGNKCVYSSSKNILVPPDERPIGMVFQSYAIWPHMDVFKNVAFPLLYGGDGKRMSRGEIRDAAIEALRLVQMERFINRPATQLSGGQQQRVALARAIVRQPKLLLLDEPLSNLDAKLREEMRVELTELTAALDITTFFVTHDQIEALALSDHVAVIMEGLIVEDGPPAQVFGRTRTRQVASFLGIANMIEGLLGADAEGSLLETAIGRFRLVGPELEGGEGREAAVVIRPQAVVSFKERPSLRDNVLEGEVRRATFLGTYIDGEVAVGEQSVRVCFDPYMEIAVGERIYLHIPPERCLVVR